MTRLPDRPSPVRSRLVSAAGALLNAIAADETHGWGGGAMTAAPYDTAWVAMVRHAEHPERLAFPETLDWLLAHQASDGSWGSRFPHTLLPTMAGLLALRRAPAVRPAKQEQAVNAATSYLETHLDQWRVSLHESVGFEVIAPFLLEELAATGVRLACQDRSALQRLNRDKLMIDGPEILFGRESTLARNLLMTDGPALLYSGKSNLIHSIEAFGGHLDFGRLSAQQAANGSFGCSPAATAAALIYGNTWNDSAAGWLRSLVARRFGGHVGGMPNAYPIDAFEASWVLYHLAHGGAPLGELPQPALAAITAWLVAALTPQGCSISRIAGLPFDSDDTGMVLAALLQAGETVDVACLGPFERETHFACFPYERGISLSANAHVLAALLSLPADQQAAWRPQIGKLTRYLLSVRRDDGSWQDKWHESPYYATACTVLAIAARDEAAVQDELGPSVRWLLDTQRDDGRWGQGNGNLEETSYALQALLAVRRDLPPGGETALQSGLTAVWQDLGPALAAEGLNQPMLWRGKELYTPGRVVLSAALGALFAGERRGFSPEIT